MKDSYFMLTLLILGPQAPGKDINVFLYLLIDELKDLWVSKVETRDAVDNSVFTLYMLRCCGLLMIFLLEVVFLGRVTKVTKPV